MMAQAGDTTQAHNPNAANVYEEIVDGKSRWVYRASSLGGCANVLLMARLGYAVTTPPPFWLQKAFDAGNENEPIILGKLNEDYGFNVYGTQDLMEIDVGKNAMIRGHIDGMNAGEIKVDAADFGDGAGLHKFGRGGMIIDPGGIIILDAKALSNDNWLKWCGKFWDAGGFFGHYLWQQSVYVNAGDWAGVVMACYNKATEAMHVSYFAKEALGVQKKDLIKRVMAIETMASKGEGELFKQACPNDEGWCPYSGHHPDAAEQADAALAKAVAKQEAARSVDPIDVESLAIQYNLYAKAEADAKADKQKVGLKIIALYDNKEAKTQLDNWTVSTYYSGSSTTQWDDIAKATGCANADAAKKKFTVSTKSATLSPKVTPKTDKQGAD